VRSLPWSELAILVPLLFLQLALMGTALTDLMRREHVRGFTKQVWILLIVMFGIVGPMMYLLYGREE